jgi:hypothetical protein
MLAKVGALRAALMLVLVGTLAPCGIHGRSALPPPPPPPLPPWAPLVYAPPRPPQAESGETELLQHDRLHMPMSAELQLRNEGVPWYENRFKQQVSSLLVLPPHRATARELGACPLELRFTLHGHHLVAPPGWQFGWVN